jgi:hypothetical protein
MQRDIHLNYNERTLQNIRAKLHDVYHDFMVRCPLYFYPLGAAESLKQPGSAAKSLAAAAVKEDLLLQPTVPIHVACRKNGVRVWHQICAYSDNEPAGHCRRLLQYTSVTAVQCTVPMRHCTLRKLSRLRICMSSSQAGQEQDTVCCQK